MGTLSEGEAGENPLEGGFWVGIMRGVKKASLAWVVILRGSFVLTLVCCARVGRFPVRMEKGSNNSRKSIVTYGFSSHLFPPPPVNPSPSPLAAQAGIGFQPLGFEVRSRLGIIP